MLPFYLFVVGCSPKLSIAVAGARLTSQIGFSPTRALGLIYTSSLNTRAKYPLNSSITSSLFSSVSIPAKTLAKRFL